MPKIRAISTIPATLAMAPAAALAQAPVPIDVLCIGPERARACADSSFAFASGDPHTTFRNAVLDPSSFGAGGVVERPIVLSEVGAFTADALAGVDVVVITQFETGDELLPCEVALLRDFVEQGGGLFAWGNRVPTTVMDVLGVGEATACMARGFAFEPVDHPVVDGPFGVAAGGVSPIFACVIDGLPAGATTLVTSEGEPMAAAIDIGAGSTVVMADDEWAVTMPACPAASRWQASTRTFGLNAFAHVAPAEGFAYADPGIPCAACEADLDGDGALTIFDFLAFQNLFDAMDPRADFDGDGDFTIFDFLAFQNAFDAGCP